MLAKGLLEAALRLAGSDSDDSDEEEEQLPLRNLIQGGRSRPSISSTRLLDEVILCVFKQSSQTLLNKMEYYICTSSEVC